MKFAKHAVRLRLLCSKKSVMPPLLRTSKAKQNVSISRVVAALHSPQAFRVVALARAAEREQHKAERPLPPL